MAEYISNVFMFLWIFLNSVYFVFFIMLTPLGYLGLIVGIGVALFSAIYPFIFVAKQRDKKVIKEYSEWPKHKLRKAMWLGIFLQLEIFIIPIFIFFILYFIEHYRNLR